MAIEVEAVYEDGVLKPAQPLPLPEHAKVRVRFETPEERVRAKAGLIACDDADLVLRIAMDPELDYPPIDEELFKDGWKQ